MSGQGVGVYTWDSVVRDRPELLRLRSAIQARWSFWDAGDQATKAACYAAGRALLQHMVNHHGDAIHAFDAAAERQDEILCFAVETFLNDLPDSRHRPVLESAAEQARRALDIGGRPWRAFGAEGHRLKNIPLQQMPRRKRGSP